MIEILKANQDLFPQMILRNNNLFREGHRAMNQRINKNNIQNNIINNPMIHYQTHDQDPFHQDQNIPATMIKKDLNHKVIKDKTNKMKNKNIGIQDQLQITVQNKGISENINQNMIIEINIRFINIRIKIIKTTEDILDEYDFEPLPPPPPIKLLEFKIISKKSRFFNLFLKL
jgi:hypothetical protein